VIKRDSFSVGGDHFGRRANPIKWQYLKLGCWVSARTKTSNESHRRKPLTTCAQRELIARDWVCGNTTTFGSRFSSLIRTEEDFGMLSVSQDSFQSLRAFEAKVIRSRIDCLSGQD
jgi:hypothetical protein